MGDFELRQRLRDLRMAREPGRDLWPGIAAGLATAPQRSARSWWPLAMAAALAGAIGLGLVLDGPRPERGIAAAGPSATPWTLGEARVLNADYEGALTQALGRNPRERPRELLSPDLAAADAVLESAQGEIEQALEMDPDSVYLLDLLRRTHARRLDVARLHAQVG
jgi:hypothetical protein